MFPFLQCNPEEGHQWQGSQERCSVLMWREFWEGSAFQILCPMDDISPMHLDVFGTGYKAFIRAPSTFIFLGLVGHPTRPFFPGLFALPDHANLNHVWRRHLCYMHVEVLNFFCGLPPVYCISGLDDLAYNYFHGNGLFTSQAVQVSCLIRYFQHDCNFLFGVCFKPRFLKLLQVNTGTQRVSQMVLCRKLMKNRLDLDFKSKHVELCFRTNPGKKYHKIWSEKREASWE